MGPLHQSNSKSILVCQSWIVVFCLKMGGKVEIQHKICLLKCAPPQVSLLQNFLFLSDYPIN